MDTRKPICGFVTHGFINSTFEDGLDGASGTLVHAVVEFEITHREFGGVDVVMQRIEFRLIEAAVKRNFGVKPLECVEELTLRRVIQGLSLIHISEPTR